MKSTISNIWLALVQKKPKKDSMWKWFKLAIVIAKLIVKIVELIMGDDG
ncbi:hypothetical protein [Marinicellulosiphila megalodicopiae]